MGLLQKIFDKSAESLCNGIDNFDGDVSTAKKTLASLAKQPITAAKILTAGVTCEATGLAAKITKKPLDTSRAGVTGKFF